MRQLKFRAWDTILKRWNYSIEIDCYGNLQEYKYNGSAFYAKYKNDYEENYEDVSDRFIICQFIGLSDLHQNKIYKGDIVKVRRIGYEYQENEYEYFAISYLEKFCCWGFLSLEWAKETLDGWGDAFESTISYQDEIEIIGNVFENKSLLDKLCKADK